MPLSRGDDSGRPGPFQFPLLRIASEADDPPVDEVSGHDVFAAFDAVSRRMEDLARALGCLGYFDDDGDDRPRAA